MSDRLTDLVRQAMALDAERASALEDAEARRELFARIVDQPLPTHLVPREVGLAPARRRRWAVVLVGGVAVAVSAVVALGMRGDGPRPSPSASGGADVFAGQPAQSCAESYTTGALARRAFGFDGTVVSIGSPTSTGVVDGHVPVTLEVHRWFRGGVGETVVVAMPRPEGSFGQESVAYRVGSRLLVSGEPRHGGAPLADPVAWACGFTSDYTPAEAAVWREAFR
ncbi:hypothetical protein ACGFI4_23290 [Micromonospora carbonacea]|uniref:hypothetical protein n=1 Tax=Micromonospora carbonacea TaxID=47853 RepID=UPI00371F8DFD